jgi:hypothetical protein
MCSQCQTRSHPLFTKMQSAGRSVMLCSTCIRQAEIEELQLQTVSVAPAAHHCRIGLQYQSLRPRLLRLRVPTA